MPTYTPAQIAQVAKGAGFAGQGLVMAVAVALAESGGNTAARAVNTDSHRSVDRGLWQINNYWHKEVTDAEAYTPAAAARHAYRISSGGSNWQQWSTAKNGMAAAQMGRAAMAAAQATGGAVGTVGTTPAGFGIPSPGDVLGGAKDGLGWIWDRGQDALGLGGQALGSVPEALGALPGVPDLGGITAGIGSLGRSMAAIASGYVKAAMWISNPHNWVRITQVAGGGALLLVGVKMVASSGADGAAAGAARAAVKGSAKAAKSVTTKAKQGASAAAQAGAAAATGGTSAAATGAVKAAKGAAAAASAAK